MVYLSNLLGFWIQSWKYVTFSPLNGIECIEMLPETQETSTKRRSKASNKKNKYSLKLGAEKREARWNINWNNSTTSPENGWKESLERKKKASWSNRWLCKC